LLLSNELISNSKFYNS